MKIKRIFFSLVAAAVPFALMWLGGLEFERGQFLVIATCASLYACGCVYHFWEVD